MMMARQSTGSCRQRAFTLVEVIFSILLIAILISISIVGIQAASRSAQASADRQAVLSLKVGVESFKQEFGFLPPLAKGEVPPGSEEPFLTSDQRANVYNPSVASDLNFLRGRTGAADGAAISDDSAFRFSRQSLPFYLGGILDANADGVDGPGFRAPRRDGTFASSGPSYQPFVDTSKKSLRAWPSSDSSRPYVVEFRDRAGIAIRYYRWVKESDAEIARSGLRALNIPKVLGDPTSDADERASPADANPLLRDAEFAIVAAGPNRVFGDIKIGGTDKGTGTESLVEIRRTLGLPSSRTDIAVEQEGRKDNIVEVGR
ncbi:MAG: prepilin-type N-terminal cleavage/methylation domain-containing protein [Phycisphaeraceae bacterium]|nr:prepilin-type N-terminal cleavage/methylation domain-containing protein [Phycisphaeraceae bacterium]